MTTRTLDVASLADARPVHGCAAPGEVLPDWPALFGLGAGRPLELELGFGRGHFALDHAAGHPELDLVAIELRRSDCDSLRERVAKRGLKNLLVLQGDARLLVPACFGRGALAAVHVHFPDPWWKKRHWKRRLVDADLSRALWEPLRPGGELDLRTDVPAYAQEALGIFEEAGWTNLDGAGALSTVTPEVLSSRERRYDRDGQPVFRMRFARPAEAAPKTPARSGREWSDTKRR